MSSTSHQLRLFDVADPCPAAGRVYAMFMPASHAIKFGWTGRLCRTRARELDAVVLASTPGTLADEATIHARLAPYRIGRTEDFWPVPAVWDEVDRIRRREEPQVAA